MKRTFIAVKINPGNKMQEIIKEFRKVLSYEKIKWVDLINLHITLSFLGDTGEDMVEVISEKVEEVTHLTEPFDLIFRGMGVFKNIRYPKVLWIGTEQNPTIGLIKKALDDELERIGFPKEERDFRSHLTIARIKWIKNRNIFEDLLKKYEDEYFQKFRIEHLIFYESILKPEGPEYIELNKVKLRK